MESDSNSVGYKKPPRHRRFIKGQSGNPKGRAKGTRNRQTILEDVLKQRVTVTVDGQRKSVAIRDAIPLMLVNAAIAGRLPQIKLVLARGFHEGAPKPLRIIYEKGEELL